MNNLQKYSRQLHWRNPKNLKEKINKYEYVSSSKTFLSIEFSRYSSFLWVTKPCKIFNLPNPDVIYSNLIGIGSDLVKKVKSKSNH